MKKYGVVIKRRLVKQLYRLPKKIQSKFYQLIKDLEWFGPILKHWPNFSKLGNSTYHCRLDYSWVVCWSCEKNQIQIEVYYVGSRENAPY